MQLLLLLLQLLLGQRPPILGGGSPGSRGHCRRPAAARGTANAVAQAVRQVDDWQVASWTVRCCRLHASSRLNEAQRDTMEPVAVDDHLLPRHSSRPPALWAARARHGRLQRRPWDRGSRPRKQGLQRPWDRGCRPRKQGLRVQWRHRRGGAWRWRGGPDDRSEPEAVHAQAQRSRCCTCACADTSLGRCGHPLEGRLRRASPHHNTRLRPRRLPGHRHTHWGSYT